MRNHKGLVFSLDEYKRRLAILREEMAKANISLALITDQENLTYLTGHQTSGYDSFQLVGVPLEGKCFSISRVLEESNFKTRTWVEETFSYLDTEDPVKTAIEIIKNLGYSQTAHIGFELDSFFLRQKTIESFRQEFKSTQWSNISRFLDRARLIKSSEEIALMKNVAGITEKAMLAGYEAAQVGKTENDIAAAIHEAMYRSGGEYPCVPPYIVTGERTNIGHATWEGRTIQKDDCVFLELAGCQKRYHTAMMRTIFMGKETSELKEAESIVLEALSESMDKMKPGVCVGDVAQKNIDIISKSSCGAWQTGRSGYSIGISFAPAWDEGHLLSLNPTNKQVFEENMTIHLIPFFMMPKQQMIMGISETVQITPTGAKSFFDLPARKVFYKN
ncbi:MAG: M24 family metallopeptidase [Bacteriovoracaceae bacterium]|jgi:Xaa-Pro dipeptidase|nr:peptidase M24 [Halobacteriovoraceae bacterium]MDP7319436.1 M24 family metallopeptidase [Bacteriovoracaceae bacterium]